MSIPCLKKTLMALAALLMLWPPVLRAQESSANFPHSITDPSGRLTLFYPDGWTIREEGLGLSDSQSGIEVWAEVLSGPRPPADWEAIPDWLIQEGYLPDAAFFSEQNYGAWPAWLGQGPGLFTEGVFSAGLAIPLLDGSWVWLRADFHEDHLAQAAPLLTSLFRQMLILPVHVRAPAGDFGLNLPPDWFYSGGPGFLLAGQTEADWSAWQNGDPPSGLAMTLWLGDEDTPPPAPHGLLSDERAALINGEPAKIELFYEPGAGTTELRLSLSGYTLGAISQNGALLLENLALWQSILGSVVIGQDS